jgi:hypothetical protein
MCRDLPAFALESCRISFLDRFRSLIAISRNSLSASHNVTSELEIETQLW